MSFLERTIKAMGEQNVNKVENKKVIVFGVGGVGGFVCDFLVRTGISNLSIVDFDVVSESNINRQIVASMESIGKFKVDVMEKRLLSINPNLKIRAINKKFTKETALEFDLSAFDYVIDAIDSVEDKLELILTAQHCGVKIISAMGAGNKISIPNFKVMDVYKTEGDGLAKKMRTLLKKSNVKSLNVVSSNEVGKKTTNGVGSVVYQVANCASVVAAFVINDIIGVK